MRKVWVNLFCNDDYSPIKILALTDIFKNVGVIMESAFQRNYGSVFLTGVAETQLFPVTILLKSVKFALMRRSSEGI